MNQQTPNTAQDLSPAGTFALVFGVAFAILYVICDMAALPLFTYHPGTGRIDPGFARAAPDRLVGAIGLHP